MKLKIAMKRIATIIIAKYSLIIKVMKKSNHWPLLKCTTLKDQIPWGTHSLIKKQKIPKGKSIRWSSMRLLSTTIWPVESCNTFGITNQVIIMLPLLFATSWYLPTQIDTSYNDVLTRLQSYHQMTCEVLKALTRKHVSSSMDMQQDCNCQN